MQTAGFLAHLCSTCLCLWSFFMLCDMPGLIRLLGLALAATSAWNVLSYTWPVYFCSSPNSRTQDALLELIRPPCLNALCLLFWFRASAHSCQHSAYLLDCACYPCSPPVGEHSRSACGKAWHAQMLDTHLPASSPDQ